MWEQKYFQNIFYYLLVQSLLKYVIKSFCSLCVQFDVSEQLETENLVAPMQFLVAWVSQACRIIIAFLKC